MCTFVHNTGEVTGSYAIIARTNFTLFEKVMQFCEKDEESKIAFAGGFESYEYDTILNMYGTNTNEDDTEIAGIKGWDDFSTQALHEISLKWKVKVSCVENYTQSTTKVMYMLFM